MALPDVLKSILTCAAIVVFAAPAGARDAPLASGGRMDLRDWDFTHEGIVTLAGDWKLRRGAFDDPAQADSASAGAPVAVPGPWNGAVENGRLMGADGFGTYALTIACSKANDLALELPMAFSAMRFYVNGRSIANQGSPGSSALSSRPAVANQMVSLSGLSCPLRLTAHVSNFEHSRGGLVRAIRLGTEQQLLGEREQGLVRDLLVVGALCVMGFLPVMFFLWRRSDRTPLYCGLFSLVLAFVTGVSGERALAPYLAPLGFEIYFKLVYLAFVAFLVLFPLFIQSLYRGILSPRAMRLILATGGVAALAIVAMPTRVFTEGIPALEFAAAAVASYLILALARAALAGRRSAALMVVGLALFAASVVHDLGAIPYPSQSDLAPYGVLVLITMPTVMLARRFSRALVAEELRLIEQRQRVDLLVRVTKAGLLNWEVTTGVVTYSERYKEMLGYAADADTSRWPALFDSIHPDEREAMRDVFLGHLRDRSTKSGVRQHSPVDHRLRRADGDYVWVHAEAISITDPDGRTLRYVASFIDISEQKRHELEMADRMRFINDLFDSVPIMLSMRDLDGRFMYVNRRWEFTTGMSREQVIGSTLHDVVSADDAASLVEFDRAAIARYEAGMAHADPEPEERTFRTRRFLQSRSVVTDAQGRPTGLIIASVDTTDRYAMEQALAAQAAQLKEQNEALQEHVRLREEVERIGRHDLKTPLASIIAVPRLLREGREFNREEEDLLTIVERAGYRLLHMVNLSLDLFKMEEGRYRFQPQAVDAEGLFAKLATDLAYQAQSKSVTIRLPAGPSVCAWAEELLCYSMFGNLMKNAIEASPEGGTVTLSIAESGPDALLLSVHNEGAVPQSVQSTFFDKYSTAGKTGGTGLGTYSARLMARTQGGDITMQSSEADGTTIAVRLQKAPAGGAAVIAPAIRGDDRAGALPGLRVLVVDEDEHNRLMVKRYLPSPIAVVSAVNGRAAVDMVKHDRFDVVLMDLDLTVMGGFEAAALIRRQESEAHGRPVTIIAMSSQDDDQLILRCLNSGFDHYLTKPLTREALQRTLRHIARGSATSGLPVAESAFESQPTPSSPGPSPAVVPAIRTDAGLARRADALPALHVLVVDDDEYNRVIVKRYLPSPITVFSAVNGRAAVDMVKANRFDVVLMDLDMPVMGGFDATALIRSHERDSGGGHVTIIALSSHDDDRVIMRCLSSGFDLYLTKPVTRETLHRTLQQVASGAVTSAPAVAQAPGEDRETVVLDAELEAELPGFLDSRHQFLDELEQALLAQDAESARRIAHRLAGSFGMYGFAWAAQTCSRMEDDARTGDTSRLREPAAAVRRHLRTAEFRFRSTTPDDASTAS